MRNPPECGTVIAEDAAKSKRWFGADAIGNTHEHLIGGIPMLVLGAFSPADPSTAIVYLAAVVCFILAAFFAPAATRMPGGAVGLIALGLALWLFPLMWNTMDIAF